MAEPEDFLNFLREEWETMRKQEYDQQKALDNAIFIVSTGTLVLSVTIAFNLVQEVSFKIPLALYLSWAFFLTCIVVHLIGYKFALLQAEHYFEAIKEARKKCLETGATEFTPSRKYSSHIDICNNGTLILLGFALISLVIFTIYNFNYFNNKNMDQDRETKNSEKASSYEMQPYNNKPVLDNLKNQPTANSSVNNTEPEPLPKVEEKE